MAWTTANVRHTASKDEDQEHPYGNVENPITRFDGNCRGATYVARAFSVQTETHGRDDQGRHPAIRASRWWDVFSPCVTYNQGQHLQWFNPRVKMLEEQGHDPADLHQAIDRGYQWGEEIPIGLSGVVLICPALEELEPILHTGEGPLASEKPHPHGPGESGWSASCSNLGAAKRICSYGCVDRGSTALKS